MYIVCVFIEGVFTLRFFKDWLICLANRASFCVALVCLFVMVMKCCLCKYGLGFNVVEFLSGNLGVNVLKLVWMLFMDIGFCIMCVREVENIVVVFCNKVWFFVCCCFLIFCMCFKILVFFFIFLLVWFSSVFSVIFLSSSCWALNGIFTIWCVVVFSGDFVCVLINVFVML